MSNEVRVDIKATEDVSKAIDRVIAKLQKLKDKKIDIDIDSASAIKQIDELDRKIKQLSGRNIDIKVDTAAARLKVRHLKERIDELGSTTPKIDLDTRAARDKIRYLIARIKEINLTKAKVDLDTKQALAQIASLKAALKSLTGEKIKVEADKNLKVKIEMDKDHFERNAKSAFNNLNKPENRAKVKMDADEEHLGGSLQKILNKLGKAEVRQKVKIEVDDNNLERSLKNALTRLGKADVRQKIKIEVDQDIFERSLSSALSQLGKKEYRKNVKVEVDQDHFGRSLASATRLLGKQEIRQKVKIDVDEFHLENMLNRAMRGINTTSSDRTVKVNVDIDGAAEIAPLLVALSKIKSKTVVIRVVTLGDGSLGRISRDFINIDRSSGRMRRTLNDAADGFTAVGGAGAKVAEVLAGMTQRIPVLGGMFRSFAALGSGGGLLSGLASGVLAVGTALTVAGTVGVIGTGALTAGLYATQAALGAVAGAASLVTAAVGGAMAGGFAYLATQTVPEVKDSLDGLVDTVRLSMEDMSKAAAPGTIKLFDSLKESFKGMEPSLQRIAEGSGKLLENLSTKMGPIAQKLGPALEKMFESGAKHMDIFANALPGVTESIGELFAKMSSPAMLQAANRTLGAIPSIINGIGNAINWSADSFNKITDFINSPGLSEMRNGFSDFAKSWNNTDWSSASEGMARAANSFGSFVGSINTNDIAGTIGSITNAFANLTDVAQNINLMGIFNGLAKSLEFVTEGLDLISKPIGWVADTMAEWEKPQVINPELKVEPRIVPGTGTATWDEIHSLIAAGVPDPIIIARMAQLDITKMMLGNPPNTSDVVAKNGDWIDELLSALTGNPVHVPFTFEPKFEGNMPFKDMIPEFGGIQIPVGVIPEIDSIEGINSALEGWKVAVKAGIEFESATSVQDALSKLEANIDVNPRLKGNADVQHLFDTLKAMVEVVPELPGGANGINALLEGQKAILEVVPHLKDPGVIQNTVSQLKTVMDLYPQLKNAGSIQELLNGIETNVFVSPRLKSEEGLKQALQGVENMAFSASLKFDPGNISDIRAKLESGLTNLKAQPVIDPDAIAAQQASIDALNLVMKMRPELNEDTPVQTLLDAVRATLEVTPKINEASDLTSMLANLRAIVDVFPELDPGAISGILALIGGSGPAPINTELKPPNGPPNTNGIQALIDTLLKPPGNLPDGSGLGALGLNTELKPPTNVPDTSGLPPIPLFVEPKFKSLPQGSTLKDLMPSSSTGQAVIVPASMNFNQNGVQQAANRVVSDILPPDMVVEPTIPPWFRSFDNAQPVDVPAQPNFENTQVPGAEVIPPIEVQIIPKFDGAMQFGVIPPLEVQIIPKFDGAIGFGVIPPLPVQVIPQFDGAIGFGVIPPLPVQIIPQFDGAVGFGVIPPLPVQVIPQFDGALGFGMIPPIPVQIIPQFDGAMGFGLIPPLPVQIIPQIDMMGVVIPPIVVPVELQMPPIPSVNITVTSNIGEVAGQIAAIPGAVGTTHTVTSNVLEITAQVNAIPKETATTHTVSSNVSAVLSQIYSLNGQNTSSTHTVNIVTNGSLPGGGGGTGIAGGIMGMTAPAMMGISSVAGIADAGLMGATGATGLSTGFNFTPKSSKTSLLTITNAVKSAVLGAWYDLGGETVENFGRGFAKKAGNAFDAIMETVGNGFGVVGEFLDGIINGDAIFGLNINDILSVVEAIQTLVKAIPAEDMNKMIDQFNNMEIRPRADALSNALSSLMTGLNDQFANIGTINLGTITAQFMPDVQNFLQTIGIPHVPVEIEPDKQDVQQKVEDAVDGAKANVDIPSTDSMHTINTNIDEVISKIDGLNNRNTQSTHTINVAVNGGGLMGGMGISVPAIGGISGISDLSGTMGIAGDAGLEGASGVTGNFSFSRTSTNSSFLLISTAVRSAILDAWKGLGSQAARVYTLGFAEGVDNARANVEASIAHLTNASIPGSLSSSGAYAAGKLTALSYADGLNSSIGKVETVGAKLGNVVQIGSSLSKQISYWGLNLSQGMFAFGKGIQSLTELVPRVGGLFTNGGLLSFLLPTDIPFLGDILGAAFKIIPIIGKLANGLISAAGYWVQNMTNPYNGKGVVQYNYYHYETTTNNFDGGLVGNPEEQARRVLDVLEQSPSTRRIRRVFGTENV